MSTCKLLWLDRTLETPADVETDAFASGGLPSALQCHARSTAGMSPVRAGNPGEHPDDIAQREAYTHFGLHLLHDVALRLLELKNTQT